MVRGRTIDQNGMARGAWNEEEDNKLRSFVLRNNGRINWRQLPRLSGLNRCGKSCRLRWLNYLKPGVRRGNYTPQEEELILRLHQEHGNRWAVIASNFPGRTDNDIKNHWNAHLSRRAVINQEQYPNSTPYDQETYQTSNSNMGEFSYLHMEQSSSMPTYDSMNQIGLMETNSNNIAASVVHTYNTEASSNLSYNVITLPRFGIRLTDFDSPNSMSSVGSVMKNLDDDMSSVLPQPFAMDHAAHNNNHLQRSQTCAAFQEEIGRPYSSNPCLDEMIHMECWLPGLMP